MKTDPLIGAQTLVAVVSFKTIDKITYALYIHKNNIRSLVFSVIGHPAIHRLGMKISSVIVSSILSIHIHPKCRIQLSRLFGFILEISAK
jgi:hypothetical protein